jgi:predicted transcriptional regulator
MRMLKSIGNSHAEIADMVGLAEADVRNALAGKR